MLHNPFIKHIKKDEFPRTNDVVNGTNVVSIRTGVNRFRRRLSIIEAFSPASAQCRHLVRDFSDRTIPCVSRSIVLHGMHDYYYGANDDPRNEVSGAQHERNGRTRGWGAEAVARKTEKDCPKTRQP